VTDYDASVLSAVEGSIAVAAGLPVSAVTVTVRAGSVVLDVAIVVPAAQSTSVQTTLATLVATPQAATNMLASVSLAGGSTISVTRSTRPAIVLLSTPAAAESNSSSGGLSIGIIVAIVAGAFALLVVALVVALRCCRKGQSGKVRASPS
jgi:hypothetical protein